MNKTEHYTRSGESTYVRKYTTINHLKILEGLEFYVTEVHNEGYLYNMFQELC